MSQNFYLKVAFHQKIKKYAIFYPQQINFSQIKHHLGLDETARDSLFSYQLVNDFTATSHDINQFLTEQQILDRLSRSVIQPNSTIKLRIFQKTLMSEQERRRKESYESLEIPTSFEKKRSKSMEFQAGIFDQTCQTQCFQATTNFFVPNQNQKNFHLSSENTHEKSTQTQPSSELQKRKNFSKSVQICIEQSRSFVHQCPKMVNSVNSLIDLNKIRSSLEESMRVTQQQKSQLQKLKEKITRKEQEKLLQKQKERNQLNDVLILFGIDAKFS